MHKHEGHIQSRIVYYLMNIHITPRTIYLTRVILVLLFDYMNEGLTIKFVFSTEKVSTTYPVGSAAIRIFPLEETSTLLP